ncbi:hypothetical protein Dimus_035468 [Dionaea muscipula]
MRPLTPPLSQISFSSQSQEAVSLDLQRLRRERPIIVDYGHDEVAASPEAEEGEIVGNGRVMFGEELQNANGMGYPLFSLFSPSLNLQFYFPL